MLALAPAVSVPKLQLSVPALMEHEPGPLYAGLMVQLTPAQEGKGSLKLAEVASPEPEFPAERV